MKSGSDIKRQFEEISSKIKRSSLPESASSLVDALVSLFNISFEETSNQIKSLRQSIENQTQTINNQTQTIADQTKQIHALMQKLDQAHKEKSEMQEIIKTMRTMLRSKNVDLDALKRLLFQGGREQKREKKTGKSDKKKSDKTDCDGSDKPKQRDRQSNKDKTSRCDAEMNRYLTMDGDVLRAETKEEATKEIPAEIEVGGKKYRFAGWKKSGVKVEIIKKSAKVTSYVPVYEAEDGQTAEGKNPEKNFLAKTVIGFGLMSRCIEDRMQNRMPMNRIAAAVRNELGFDMTRQQLSGYSIDSSEWLLPAYELLKDKVLSDRIIHLDETFIHCQEEENSRQYMLVFASENGCFYHYTNSRSQTVPLEILQPVFEGGGQSVICTDGWYDPGWLADSEGNHKATHVGCMVHLRRYFWNVREACKNCKSTDTVDYFFSNKIIELLKNIFWLDKECKTPEERTKSRKSGEVGKFFGELMATAESAYNVVRCLKNPELCYTAKFVKAVTYAHNQREKFERIMEDGDIPLDNSEAERSIRDFAVLRHSTPSGFGSVKGAKSAAILSSFHETCKKFGLRLSEYMEFLFRKIGMFKDMLDDKKISSDEKKKILEPFMPWNYNKAQIGF